MSNLPNSCQWQGTLSTHYHGRNQQALGALSSSSFKHVSHGWDAPVASLASSVAKLHCEGRSHSFVFRSAQLVLKSLTLNLPHQLEAMSPVRTGCHISKILNVCACSCPFPLLFPAFPCFKLKEKPQGELMKEKIPLFLGGDWFFFMFLYYDGFAKGNNTHSFKITPASM